MKAFLLYWDSTQEGGGKVPEGIILAENATLAESAVYKHHVASGAGMKRGTVHHWVWEELPILQRTEDGSKR